MEMAFLYSTSADAVATTFYNWIARFEKPSKLATDEEFSLKVKLFQALSKFYGVKLQHTSSYHPFCNGKIECLHRTLKIAIKAFDNLSWIDTLSAVLVDLCTAM
ncbi:integrase catalytic domain-containing protein [Nephila pilipes]|uniref:Integrase catalytic domain-containing protein n=1 Tax=Nephila pilipes TaxID=299642 RepID=A0A8X6TZF9_NEPPI|nr:integrase catalytic domain-containing protein [Nephila pilipes]